MTRFLEVSGIKKSNMPHGSILPINYILASKDLTTTQSKSTEMLEAYNLYYASCIDSLIYIICYIQDDTSVLESTRWQKNSRQPGEKHAKVLIHLLCYTNQHTQFGLRYYSDVTKSPVYQFLQENNITPSIHMLTLCDSIWDDDHDTSRSTGGFLIFFQIGVVDHSSYMNEH
jgi:hypothetical protein